MGLGFDFTFGYGGTASLLYGAATAGNITGGAVISNFHTLIQFMRQDPARLPSVVPPANQANIATWVSWLKANWNGGYQLNGWMASKKWKNSPIGAFFIEMAGSTGTTLIQMAPWLSTQSSERVVETTLLIGTNINLSPENLEKLASTTTAALRWWATRVKDRQLGPQYLNTIVRNMAPPDAKAYSVPIFYNPYDEDDSSGIWWKFMKDTGWNKIIDRATVLSFNATAKENTRLMAEAARWQAISTALRIANFSEPIHQLQKQVGTFYKKWTDTDRSFKVMRDTLRKNPSLKSKYGAEVARLEGSASDLATDVYSRVQPFGMWPGDAPQSLGAALTIVKAGIAVGALAALGAVIIYTNKMATLLDGAGSIERNMLVDVAADIKGEIAQIDDDVVILKQRRDTGTPVPLAAGEYDKKYNALKARRDALNKERRDIAKQAGKTGVLGKIAVVGAIGVAGIIAWKVR